EVSRQPLTHEGITPVAGQRDEMSGTGRLFRPAAAVGGEFGCQACPGARRLRSIHAAMPYATPMGSVYLPTAPASAAALVILFPLWQGTAAASSSRARPGDPNIAFH